jgi:GC-rich sequence DNA-binding factor
LGCEENLIQRANAIFEDVYEDFASIENIKERFELWKRKYPESYKQSYTSIPLRDILAPFIRIELLQWDPFVNPQLDTMHWHKVLFNYGLGPQQRDYDEDDEDSQLIPALVEKVVFPKVKTLLAMAWNPTSRTQNLQGLELVREMAEFVGAEKLKVT